jgi:hypothetical protein
LRDSTYDGRIRRGAAFFAFGGSVLTPSAFQMLLRGVTAALAQAESRLILSCSYDQLEAKDAAEGRKLAQERCDTAQRVAAQRGLVGARIRASLAAPGKGPDFRRVAFAVEAPKPAERPREAARPPDPPAAAGAYQFAGRTGVLSRISSERRAVLRVRLQFGAGGTLGVDCSAESADGGRSACYGQRTGGGRWALNGTTLCLSAAALNLPGNACYQVSGAGDQLTLAGGGFLAGTMRLE